MPHSVPLPPHLSDVPFATSAAIQLGVTPGRLRGPDLLNPFRGSRMHRASVSRLTVIAAYAARMPPSHVFSHTTAAELLGLRLPEGGTRGPIHVGALHPTRAPKSAGVRGHELLARTRVVSVPTGFRATHPVDTWLSSATLLGVDDLIVMGDGLVCRQQPVANLEELRDAVAAARLRPGVAKLRRALEEIRPGTDSGRETTLRLLLTRAGLPEPEVNGEIRDRSGRFVALGDLLYRAQSVLVEYDGGEHRMNERQFHRDVARLDDVMELGIRVIRVNKDLMARPSILLAKVARALQRPVRSRE